MSNIELYFGPPGTGKTTVLMDRLAFELKSGVPSEQIAYVSFTNEGTDQGSDRARQVFALTEKQLPYFRTLHSLAFKELNLSKNYVVGRKAYRYFSEKMGMHFYGHYTADLKSDDDRYLFLDDLIRNNPRAAKRYLYDLDTAKFEYVRKNYKEFKRVFSLVDYTDMIEQFVARGKSVPVRVAFIDEAQDLTTLQWQMVWTAFKDCERIYIAGDDDQAIFQWAGADVDQFLSIEGKHNILNESHRLPDNILAYAKNVTNKITTRVKKEYHGTGKQGVIDVHALLSDIRIDDNKTYMFLSRNNSTLSMYEDMLRANGCLYRLKGELSIKPTEVRAIKQYEKLRKTRLMSEHDVRVLSPYLRENVDLNLPWYEAFNWDHDKCMYIRDVIANKTDLKECKIDVGTIHSVKGGEAQIVVMTLDVSKQVYKNMCFNPDSEHRVFYVGMTRAKEELHLIQGKGLYSYKV